MRPYSGLRHIIVRSGESVQEVRKRPIGRRFRCQSVPLSELCHPRCPRKKAALSFRFWTAATDLSGFIRVVSGRNHFGPKRLIFFADDLVDGDAVEVRSLGEQVLPQLLRFI